MTSAGLLLHPVRLRIVQQFLGRGQLTTSALQQHLADVPSATLYRQVAALLDGDVLDVVDERRVRGAVERTYVLRSAAASVQSEEAAKMSEAEHRESFLTFVAGLLGDFDRYVERGDVDLARDLVGYHQRATNLSDEEMRDFIRDLRTVIEPRLHRAPSPERKRRLITTILMPDVDPSSPLGPDAAANPT